MYIKYAHCTHTVKYAIKDSISTQNYTPNLSPINNTNFKWINISHNENLDKDWLTIE
jgi:hypothetical protein